MTVFRRECLRVVGLFLLFQVSIGIYLYERPNRISAFSYEGKTGPKFWCDLPGNEHCCGGKYSRQSPIDLKTVNLAELKNKLNFDGYATSPTTMEITNNGHTVLGLSTELTRIPTIAGGPLSPSNVYYLDSIHLHWGPDDASGGAEHLVNGKRHPMEMHLVHYNSKYGDTVEARRHFDGLTVLAVLITVGKYDNPAFSSLIDNLKYIRNKDNTREIKSMVLSTLLPKAPAYYYAYPGSLTTPPCSETVSWIVFANTLRMSSNQISQFRKLQETTKAESTGDKPILKNFRPKQDLNGRTVYLSSSRENIWFH